MSDETLKNGLNQTETKPNETEVKENGNGTGVEESSVIKELRGANKAKEKELKETRFDNAKLKLERMYPIDESIEKRARELAEGGKDPESSFILALHEAGKLTAQKEKKEGGDEEADTELPTGTSRATGSLESRQKKPEDYKINDDGTGEMYDVLMDEERKGNIFFAK